MALFLINIIYVVLVPGGKTSELAIIAIINGILVNYSLKLVCISIICYILALQVLFTVLTMVNYEIYDIFISINNQSMVLLQVLTVI